MGTIKTYQLSKISFINITELKIYQLKEKSMLPLVSSDNAEQIEYGDCRSSVCPLPSDGAGDAI
jgi:hypothetical protein